LFGLVVFLEVSPDSAASVSGFGQKPSRWQKFAIKISQMAAESSSPVHPFANSKQLLEVIPDKIDVEEESRLYDELCYVSTYAPASVVVVLTCAL
jgi:hypothetical protein